MAYNPVVAKPFTVFSKDRLDGSISSQNFNVDLTAPGKEHNSRIKLNHIAFWHTWKNINTHTKQIRITEDVDAQNDPQTYTFTCTEGNYNATELAAQLATDLTTQSAASGQSITYSCSYDNNADTFTFSTATAGKTFKFLWSNSLTTMARILGFDTSSDSDVVADVAGTPTGAVASIASDLSPLVNGITSVEFHINKFSDGYNTENANQNSDIMASIPIESLFSESQVYRPNYDEIVFNLPNLHNQVNFRLSCNFNNGVGRVDLPSNSDWSISFADLESSVHQDHKAIKTLAATGYLGN